MSKGKVESRTNNLLDQQISANLQQLLVWHSRDEDRLQSQWSGVQIQVGANKKNWGVRSRDRVINGVRDRDRVRRFNRVRTVSEE